MHPGDFSLILILDSQDYLVSSHLLKHLKSGLAVSSYEWVSGWVIEVAINYLGSHYSRSVPVWCV